MKPKKGNFGLVSNSKRCWLYLEVNGELVWTKRVTFAEKEILVDYGVVFYTDFLADLDD